MKLHECTSLGRLELMASLHKEVQDFCDWISPTEKEDQVRGFVVRRIINAIESAVPNSHATAFGSFITKLYLPDAYTIVRAQLRIGILI